MCKYHYILNLIPLLTLESDNMIASVCKEAVLLSYP